MTVCTKALWGPSLQGRLSSVKEIQVYLLLYTFIEKKMNNNTRDGGSKFTSTRLLNYVKERRN